MLFLLGNPAGDCDFGPRRMRLGLRHLGSVCGRSCRTDTVVSRRTRIHQVKTWWLLSDGWSLVST